MVIIFTSAIGKDPKELNVGILIDEFNYKECVNHSLVTAFFNNSECVLNHLPCRFLQHIDDEYAKTVCEGRFFSFRNECHSNFQIYFEDYDEAFLNLRKGRLTGIVHFPRNYSKSFEDVLNLPTNVTSQTILNGQVEVLIDKNDFLLTAFIKKTLIKTYTNFNEKLMRDCRSNKRTRMSPLKFEKPIFNTDKGTFMLSGFILG